MSEWYYNWFSQLIGIKSIPSIRSFTTDRHFFADLPYVCKRHLSDFIDLETRINLRKCSKRTQIMVDNLPLSFRFVEISAHPFHIKLSLTKDGEGVYLNNMEHTEEWEDWWPTYNWVDEKTIENAVDMLATLLKNKCFRISSLRVLLLNQIPELTVAEKKIYLVLTLIKMHLATLDHQLLVEEIFFWHRENQDELLCILPYLKTGYLKRISIRNQEHNHSNYGKVVQLEQFQAVEKLVLKDCFGNGSPLEYFWNVPSVQLIPANLQLLEIDRLIQHYLQLSTFKEAHFGGMSRVLSEVFSYFNEHGKERKATIQGPSFKIRVIYGLDNCNLDLKRL